MKKLLNEPITVTHPDKVKFWDYHLNSGSPEDITYKERGDAWWHCDSGHRWKQPIVDFLKRQTDCMWCSRPAVVESKRLVTRFSKIAKEWHEELNKHVSPETIKSSSTRESWWKCRQDESHVWCQPVRSRTRRGALCPFCKPAPAGMSLSDLHPDIARHWDYERNNGLLPEHVLPHSDIVVYWRCQADDEGAFGHKLKREVRAFVETGIDCWLCKRSKNSYGPLASSYPEIASEWDMRANHGISPDDVSAGDGFLAWWQCPVAKDHKWRIAVYSRTIRGTGCPFCAKFHASSTHSLAVTYPHLLREWHKKLNSGIDPAKLSPNSDALVYWRCPSNRQHIYQSRVITRTHGAAGCPYCSRNKVFPSETSLQALYPQIAKRWHKTKNGKLRPSDVTARSGKKVWWYCNRGPDHEWQAAPGDLVAQKYRCPFCAHRRLSKTDSLQARFPKIARQWDKEKNGDLLPRDVPAFSNQKAWWVCSKNKEHRYESRIANRTANGSDCPYCDSKRISAKENSLKALYPQVARDWHKTKNGSLGPQDVTAHTNKKVWWRCKRGPDHEWLSAVSNRTNKGAGCPACAGKQASVTNSLQSLYPQIARQWHKSKNGNL
ncbi:MAG TPA: zinc-ribbon domain-containing protein [Candidatus Obscuribacter sp.]|nr:zinc-ribbon domain-containing protein [Candidatus Obscuribacter sp.]HND06451.1 zinc-ribbon domain-containing protein [Candidatus Obscuribacter sp.]